MIHLEGMGILGSILAWTLDRHGKKFTWHDNELKVCAWRASTGAIYPSGDAFDRWNYEAWKRWYSDPPWHEKIFVEQTGWWYCTKAAPHGAKDKPVARAGDLQRSSACSMHFNAQHFVRFTRDVFAEQRRSAAPAGSTKVVAHGFNRRLDHYVWGWNRKVRLSFSETLTGQEYLPRASLYFREGRFVMAYAYAVPGDDTWYAGSSLIVQKKPNPLDMASKYERWKSNFHRLGDGRVTVASESEFTEGWRPAASDKDTSLASWIDGSLVLRPLWNSGIRHSPAVMRAALEALGVKA